MLYIQLFLYRLNYLVSYPSFLPPRPDYKQFFAAQSRDLWNKAWRPEPQSPFLPMYVAFYVRSERGTWTGDRLRAYWSHKYYEKAGFCDHILSWYWMSTLPQLLLTFNLRIFSNQMMTFLNQLGEMYWYVFPPGTPLIVAISTHDTTPVLLTMWLLLTGSRLRRHIPRGQAQILRSVNLIWMTTFEKMFCRSDQIAIPAMAFLNISS